MDRCSYWKGSSCSVDGVTLKREASRECRVGAGTTVILKTPWGAAPRGLWAGRSTGDEDRDFSGEKPEDHVSVGHKGRKSWMWWPLA